MEGSIYFDDFIHIIVGDMLANFDKITVKLFKLLIRNTLGSQTGSQNIKADTDFVNFGDIFNGNIGNIGTATGNHNYKAFQLQLTDCFAHGRTAYAHFVSQLDFHEAFAGAEGAVNNSLTDIFTDKLTQRLVAV